jgi:hypothetical protein
MIDANVPQLTETLVNLFLRPNIFEVKPKAKYTTKRSGSVSSLLALKMSDVQSKTKSVTCNSCENVTFCSCQQKSSQNVALVKGQYRFIKDCVVWAKNDSCNHQQAVFPQVHRAQCM